MFRLLLLFALLFWPVVSSTDTGARDPLTHSHERAFADAHSLTPLVEKRFVLAAAIRRCDFADNHYAFNFVLDKFANSERWILRKAADAGAASGAARAADATCPAAVDRLRIADNELLSKAELLPSRRAWAP